MFPAWCGLGTPLVTGNLAAAEPADQCVTRFFSELSGRSRPWGSQWPPIPRLELASSPSRWMRGRPCGSCNLIQSTFAPLVTRKLVHASEWLIRSPVPASPQTPALPPADPGTSSPVAPPDQPSRGPLRSGAWWSWAEEQPARVPADLALNLLHPLCAMAWRTPTFPSLRNPIVSLCEGHPQRPCRCPWMKGSAPGPSGTP